MFHLPGGSYVLSPHDKFFLELLLQLSQLVCFLYLWELESLLFLTWCVVITLSFVLFLKLYRRKAECITTLCFLQAVFSDSGGSVFHLQFRRVMGVRTAESDCLFSGSRGEVCCVLPLLFGEKGAGKALAEMRIVAMASLTKVFLVRLRPKLEVLFTFGLKGELGTLPLLDWRLVPVEPGSGKVLLVVISFHYPMYNTCRVCYIQHFV